MKTKEFLPTILVGLISVAWLCFVVIRANAQGVIPEGVESFTDVFGRACTVTELGGIDCDFNPCLECEVEYVPTPNPTTTPIIPPPLPTATPEATPTLKESCNRGIGNGAEECDPGNSGGKPGAAGEDNE